MILCGILRKEKEDFTVAFFTEAFLGFYINYIREHEEINLQLLQMEIKFLFDKFLSTVRNYERVSNRARNIIIR